MERWRKWEKINASQYFTNPLVIKFCVLWEGETQESGMSSCFKEGLLAHGCRVDVFDA